MMDKRMLLLAIGGLALVGVLAVAAGLTVRRQTNKLRNNIRTVSRGIYNFGSALQLLSGADAAEDDCERCTTC